MNLEKLFNMQKELDERILTRFPELRNEDLLPKKILALQVELGECAQNWRGFKFWSSNQKPRTEAYSHQEEGNVEGGGFYSVPRYDKNPLLEEYVDCLHFTISIALELGLSEFTISEHDLRYHKNSVLKTFSMVFEDVNDLNRYELMQKTYPEDLLSGVLGLGYRLGFTWEQIEQAYFDKNAINHTRQDTGY